jgi:hypothetical protein
MRIHELVWWVIETRKVYGFLKGEESQEAGESG